MPSIPQSLLWISLVVLWLFVLVPMLISKRDAVRRTSDVALSTRVVNTGGAARLLRRGRPAAGHRSDPDWRPSEEDPDEDACDEPAKRAAVVAAAVVVTDAEPDYLDVDVIEEDSGALPLGETAAQAAAESDQVPLDDADPDGTDEKYEYVDDSSGLEAPSDADLALADSMTAARRRRYESTTAASVSARKYKFRKRMLALMAMVLVASAAAAFTRLPAAWWVCGSVAAVTILYLGYLRRQTRIEARLHRRRFQRLARSRLGVENTDDPEFDVVPSRLRRPGAVVLEIDDEDPIFEHLDYGPSARDYDLPRAAGQ